jgi:hypothetical protein
VGSEKASKDLKSKREKGVDSISQHPFLMKNLNSFKKREERNAFAFFLPTFKKLSLD